ncbi:hypothetical protein C0J52_12621 [Blattella germanica]|nr:hypothetical protein C0J52_12621 [Blattella germanica]
MRVSHCPLWWTCVLAILVARCQEGGGARVLMATMGGTKSHKTPFLALARGLISRGHNITFLNAFPPDSDVAGLEEITPLNFVLYVRNYTNWDLLGMRMSGQEAVPPSDVLRYGYYSCDALLSDPETRHLLNSDRHFDLVIVDGSYPECPVALAYHFKAPFMYINSVAFYMTSITHGGSPAPYSVTPFLARPFIDDMNFLDRVKNTVYQSGTELVHEVFTRWILEPLMRNHFGPTMPHISQMVKNVSFILQNGHATDLEDFVSGSEAGFIYVSMGSSVLTAKMPEMLRLMFIRAFAQLPYRVLWKWEAGEGSIPDLPENMRAFVTHGGLLSMFETVYHGVPVVTMPVFCDHDANSAKAELDGYALKLELQDLTTERLLWAINEVIRNPKYREGVRQRQWLLRDQPEHPLDRAVYWTEYVLRHKGAYHLHSPAKDYTFVQYYLLDVYSFLLAFIILSATLLFKFSTSVLRLFLYYIPNPNSAAEDELVNMKKKVKMAISSANNFSESQNMRNSDVNQNGMTLRNGTVISNGNNVNGLLSRNEKNVANGYKSYNRNENSRLKIIENPVRNGKVHHSSTEF